MVDTEESDSEEEERSGSEKGSDDGQLYVLPEPEDSQEAARVEAARVAKQILEVFGEDSVEPESEDGDQARKPGWKTIGSKRKEKEEDPQRCF